MKSSTHIFSWGKVTTLYTVRVCVCTFDHCLTSNRAEIKAQNKCCENKSPRAVTHDCAQDTDGVCGERKSMEIQQVLENSVCMCVCEICLKWPCVSSSLEGSRSCVAIRPVSSLCSCGSVMLRALNTKTQLC